MAKNPRLDRSQPKTVGTIHPPHPVGGGMAVFEQNHHFFDTHGRYLGSHEGYEPGHDAGAAADSVIATMRDMSDEAKAKIMRELGLMPAAPAKPTRRKVATLQPVEQAGDGEQTETDVEQTADDGQETDSTAAGLAPRGPLQPVEPVQERERIGGIDLIGWGKGDATYPFFQVKKAFHDAYPDKASGDTKAVLDGMVELGLIGADERRDKQG